MKLSCLLAIVAHAGLSYVYYRAASHIFDSPWNYIAPAGAALLTIGGISSFRMGRAAARDAALIRNSDWSIMPRDGQRAAINGTLEAVQRPVIAPISGREAIIYEFEITRTEIGEDGKRTGADFTGIGMAPCLVRGESRTVELHGYPLLDRIAFEGFTSAEDILRTRRYLLATNWTDCTGMKLLSGAANMMSSLLDDEREIRRDWRIVSEKNCPWLDPSSLKDDGRTLAPSRPPVDDEEDDEEDDLAVEELNDIEDDLDDEEDEGEEEPTKSKQATEYDPLLFEKRLEPGARIIAIGYYDPSRFALVSHYAGGNLGLSVFRDDPETAVKKLRSKSREGYFAAFLLTLVANLGLFGAHFVFLNNDSTQSNWRSRCIQAMNERKLETAAALIDRGLRLTPERDTGKTLLHYATAAEFVELLVAKGVAIDAIDSQGHTALHEAVIQDRVDVVRALLAAGADRTRLDMVEKRTALEMAIGRGRIECAAEFEKQQ